MKRGKWLSDFLKYGTSFASIYFLYWAYSNGYFSLILDSTDEFLFLLKQHVTLVFYSSVLAILISVPAGILITRKRFQRLEWVIVALANIGQTIPSIAFLALLMLVLGIGTLPSIIALFAYSLLPILRNTIEGIKAVDPLIKDAAKGIGLTPLQILWKVEIPNSLSIIAAGVRISVVLNIGSAALAYLIGGGGLGDYIFTGIEMVDYSYLLSGAVPVTLLAVMADFFLRNLEKILIPRGINYSQKTNNL
ncbi:ABC transporter permease [Bacillus sp. FSL H8-0547]